MEIYCLTALEAGDLKSRCQRNHSVSEASRGGSFSLQSWVTSAGVLQHPNICLCGQRVLALCLSLLWGP